MKFLNWILVTTLVSFATSMGRVTFAQDVVASGDQAGKPKGQLTYDFPEAAQRGVVELFSNPWAAVDPKELIDRLPDLNAGLVNRVGFQFAGFNMKKLEYATKLADHVKAVLPMGWCPR